MAKIKCVVICASFNSHVNISDRINRITCMENNKLEMICKEILWPDLRHYLSNYTGVERTCHDSRFRKETRNRHLTNVKRALST